METTSTVSYYQVSVEHLTVKVVFCGLSIHTKTYKRASSAIAYHGKVVKQITSAVESKRLWKHPGLKSRTYLVTPADAALEHKYVAGYGESTAKALADQLYGVNFKDAWLCS
jgi:hypothetical protein